MTKPSLILSELQRIHESQIEEISKSHKGEMEELKTSHQDEIKKLLVSEILCDISVAFQLIYIITKKVSKKVMIC